MGKGILRKYKERFDMEYKVWHEAREVVGEDVIRVRTAKFNSLILEHLNKKEVYIMVGFCKRNL